jgi:imidazole glycerol-phosphate synthase subunit HisF
LLRPRVIPCLLIHKGGLVKTVQFGAPKYLGDPLNAVRIFNEKEVDELMVIDIDCSRLGKPPNEKLIAELAAECRMPLCYGGGIKTVTQIEKLITLGVEKVAISSAAVESKELIGLAADRVGRQSIVGVIDIKRTGMFRKLEVVTYNGTRRTGLDPIAHAIAIEELGVGEIVLNSVDHDGMMDGYDLELAEKVREKTSVPLTVLGGAGSMDHVRALVDKFPIIGAAAGSLFVFKGKLKGVLINYPSNAERDSLTYRN